MKDLREKTIRGGFAKVCSQGATFVLRLGSLAILGRILEPSDFGLVGMVAAVMGVFNLFKDFGLSTASIQQSSITDEQISTLFWINMLVGTILAMLSVAAAPIIASFYHEPRLIWVTIALAAGFVTNAAGVQHSAILQRQMKFAAIAGIETVSQVISTAIGIGMAFCGYGYWSLVAMTLAVPIGSTLGAWVITAWVPGTPQRNSGIHSIIGFGGTVTLNGLVVYVAYNLEKVLLGRFWGADAVGIYGRAYQLINIPTENLNSAVGGVAFSALSRLQHDPIRFKGYFLTAYSLVLALTIPITLACGLFADDMIHVVMGPKWHEAVPIFQLLAPTIAIYALINPLSWLLFSSGLVGRSLKVAMVIAPLTITGYFVGLPYGPKGVALAYSTVMTVWAIPHIAWCIHGTIISVRDIVNAVSRPLLSGVVAAAVAVGAHMSYDSVLTSTPRLLLDGSVLLGSYLGMLMFVMGQKTFYLNLLKELNPRSSSEENVLVSA